MLVQVGSIWRLDVLVGHFRPDLRVDVTLFIAACCCMVTD